MWEGKTHPALRGGLLRRTLLLQERERERWGRGSNRAVLYTHSYTHTHTVVTALTQQRPASCKLQILL